MRIEPEMSGVSIVLLGSFNPAIFTPAWFAMHKILPKKAADNADVQVVHAQLSVFSTEWLQLQVTPDRFQAATQQAPHVRVHDLVMRVFKEHLFHTPVNAFGINRQVHFRAASPAARDRVGRQLAPVKPWGKIAKALQLDGEGGGMVSLTMRQSHPEGRPPDGQINVTVEPSVQIDGGRSGIYVHINDHYAVGDATDNVTPDERAKLFGFLEDDFESSIQQADVIIDHVMSLAIDQEGEGS